MDEDAGTRDGAIVPRRRRLPRRDVLLRQPAPDVTCILRRSVSPDGTRIAYVADCRIYLRALANGESNPIAGADPGVQPAFSPNGESIAFWADPALKRISVHRGVPVTVCETKPAPSGSTGDSVSDRPSGTAIPNRVTERLDGTGRGHKPIAVAAPAAAAASTSTLHVSRRRRPRGRGHVGDRWMLQEEACRRDVADAFAR
jgi:hypothetical protein